MTNGPDADDKEAFGRWVYGDAGDRFPVKRRDILAVGDRVTVACGDIEEGHAQIVANEYGPPDITYTDPPWNTGNVNTFRTKAGLEDRSDFEDFISTLAHSIASTRRDVFVETGVDNIQLTRRLLEKAGGNFPYAYNTTYYGNKPAALLHGHFNGPEPDPIPDLQGQDDADTPYIALGERAESGDIVFDPCFGNEGLTGQAAWDNDCQILGTELHPRRLAAAIEIFVDNFYEDEDGGPRPDTLVSRVARLPESSG